ncbi:hypothetical protein [Dyadobacter sp. CY351]|uniref:hypothetical protein n=1 Tax=Dyadobacter sp. CY351 TaxID=2909337 RepID=UPI001F15D5CE|nr:hypothetical protein [Dyadobacter sp. CY351]MCF2520948.1 hypothetical protein [Dyadobacter sp. CY351]
MSVYVIPAVIENKKSFVMAALDLLPGFEADLNRKDICPYSFALLANTLVAYPSGVCLFPNSTKSLIHCADSLVSASLAVLWQGELKVADVEKISDLLKSALDSICTVKNQFEL